MTAALLIAAMVAAIGGLVSCRLWRPAHGHALWRAVATWLLVALVAALAVLRHRRLNPMLIVLPVLGVVLAVLGDNHGPAILLGFAAGALPGPWWREPLEQFPTGPDVGQPGAAGADGEP